MEKSLSEALSSLSEKVVDNFASVRKAREDPRRILNFGGTLQNRTMLRLLEHYSVALREPKPPLEHGGDRGLTLPSHTGVIPHGQLIVQQVAPHMIYYGYLGLSFAELFRTLQKPC